MDFSIIIYACIPLLFVIIFGYIFATSRERDKAHQDVEDRLASLEQHDTTRISCPTCRTLNPASAKFCNECGYPLGD